MLASPRILTLAAIIGVLGSGAAAVALVGPDPGYRGVAGLSGSGRRPAGSAQAAPAQAERREAPARTGQRQTDVSVVTVWHRPGQAALVQQPGGPAVPHVTANPGAAASGSADGV